MAQAFGKGHVAALLIGDLWRWGMRRENPAEDDFDRSWRQTVRWLVGDVPSRLEVSVRPKLDSETPALHLGARVRDAEYRPLDNAKVTFRVELAGGKPLTLDAEPDLGARRVLTPPLTFPASRAPTASSPARPPRTGAHSVNEKPAGPLSRSPTSSPAWSPTVIT